MTADPAALVARATRACDDDRFDDARGDLEAAFALLDGAGESCAAARVAAVLAGIHVGCLGNEAVGRGWARRAERLLDGVGPCVERGYVELAILACDRADIDDLARSAAAALTIARTYGDVALEVRALADGAVALISQGRMGEGLARIDEVMAMLSSGQIADEFVVGTTLCSLLSSCDRAGDLGRATESIRLAESLTAHSDGAAPKMLATHCKVTAGSVLCASGRCAEGEAALLAALGAEGSTVVTHRNEARARLADLRLVQGRVDEAAELLAPIEDAVAAAAPLGSVHLRSGQPDLAVVVLRSGLQRLVNDVSRGARLAALLVEAELARDDVRAARSAFDLLSAMAAATDSPVAVALARLSAARLAVRAGDLAAAVENYEASAAALPEGHQPLVVATALVEVAEVHLSVGEVAAAVIAARSAHAVATRIAAGSIIDRAGALLRQSGVTPPRPSRRDDGLRGLTAREMDVLAGLSRGLSNPAIAERLYLSPKTVEHHVGRILAKLGVRSRAEAAAVAARSGDPLGEFPDVRSR